MKIEDFKSGRRVKITTKRVWWFFPPDYFYGKYGIIVKAIKFKAPAKEVIEVKVDDHEKSYWFRVEDLQLIEE